MKLKLWLKIASEYSLLLKYRQSNRKLLVLELANSETESDYMYSREGNTRLSPISVFVKSRPRLMPNWFIRTKLWKPSGSGGHPGILEQSLHLPQASPIVSHAYSWYSNHGRDVSMNTLRGAVAEHIWRETSRAWVRLMFRASTVELNWPKKAAVFWKQ